MLTAQEIVIELESDLEKNKKDLRKSEIRERDITEKFMKSLKNLSFFL